MRKYLYSIVRFRPFVELGEFANIGVLVIDVDSGNMGFRMAPNKFTRIEKFFGKANYEAYRNVIGYITNEIRRFTSSAPLIDDQNKEYEFLQFIKEKESSVIFSKPIMRLYSGELDSLVDILYGIYISRDIENTENIEALFTKNLRIIINQTGNKNFKKFRIDDNILPITLPLAYEYNDIYGIKPLVFSQKTALRLFDHGASWKKRFEYLLDNKKLKERNLIIAIDPPSVTDATLLEAYEITKKELKELPFEIVSSNDKVKMRSRIIDLVSQFPSDKTTLQLH